MWFFYMGVLSVIAYISSEQRDADNWDTLRRHYKELREQEEKTKL